MTKKEIRLFAKRLVSESIIDQEIDEKKIALIVNAIDAVPFPYSQMILEEYGRLITIEKSKQTLTITSAHEIESVDVDKITKNFNKGMTFVETAIDKTIIAGVRIANADYVIDLSLKREIIDLGNQLL